MNDYKAHFKAVSNHINMASRLLHYHLHLAALVNEESENYHALNSTARFWNDYNYSTIQSIVIILGRIFDKNKKTRTIFSLLKLASANLAFFSKKQLRLIKEALGLDPDLIEEVLNRAHELNLDDMKDIDVELKNALSLWEKVKHLRHNIYAHHAPLNEEKIQALYKDVSYGELEELINIVLKICFILENAEINGRKPDLADYDTRAEFKANHEVDRLMTALVKGYKD